MEETIRPLSFGMLRPCLRSQYLLRRNDVVSMSVYHRWALLHPQVQLSLLRVPVYPFRSVSCFSQYMTWQKFSGFERGVIIRSPQRNIFLHLHLRGWIHPSLTSQTQSSQIAVLRNLSPYTEKAKIPQLEQISRRWLLIFVKSKQVSLSGSYSRFRSLLHQLEY